MKMKMKIKNLFMLATITIVAGLFSSCSQVVPSAQDADQEVPVIPELRGVTFHFALPGQDAQIVDPRAIHDNPEWEIDKLWLYELDKNGETLMADPIDIAPELVGGTPATYTYKNDKWKHGEVRQFYFVANIDDLGLKQGASLQQLEDAVLKNKMATASSDILYSVSGNEYRIPMTGIAEQKGNKFIAVAAGYPVEVKLIRAVARIDVINRLPGFKITNVELLNSFESSYVHNDYQMTKGYQLPRISKVVSSFYQFTAPVDGARTPQEVNSIRKAFYLYEGKNEGAADKDITKVIITADHDGKTGLKFVIPFKRKDSDGNFTIPVNVRRNHLYTIVVGSDRDPANANVSFTLKDQPWNVLQLEEIFRLFSVSGGSFTQGSSSSEGTLTAEATAKGYSLTFSTNFSGSYTYDVTAYPDWVTDVQVTGDTLTFNVAQNDTGAERKGTIEVTSSIAPTEKYIITVQQAGV